MTAKEYAARVKYLNKENCAYGEVLEENRDPNSWPLQVRPRPLRVLRSRDFLVMAYAVDGAIARLTVCRTMIDRDGNWIANIPWETLQEIKRQAGFGEACAIEIYPPDIDMVNVASMRHLWIVEESPSFMWRKHPRRFNSLGQDGRTPDAAGETSLLQRKEGSIE